MSIYETSITNPKKQLEFYKQLSEQLQQENKQLREKLDCDLQYMQREITVITNSPANDIATFRNYLSEIIKEAYPHKIVLIDDTILHMVSSHSNKNGIRNEYSFHEIFEHYLKKKIRMQERNMEIMQRYFELIYDLGVDYDGCNTIEGLKGLIDEIMEYVLYGRTYDTTKPIYINQDKEYNILHEKI